MKRAAVTPRSSHYALRIPSGEVKAGGHGPSVLIPSSPGWDYLPHSGGTPFPLLIHRRARMIFDGGDVNIIPPNVTSRIVPVLISSGRSSLLQRRKEKIE